MNKNEINKLLKKINNNYSRLNDYCKTNFKLIHNEIENLKLFTKSKPKKTKQALNFFVSLLKNILIISLFSLPFSTQLETMINNKNYMLEYNLSNYSLQSSMQNYEFSLLPGKENLYQHCFTLNADCYIYEGSLKNIFLIYSKDENNKFSEFDFKELKLTNKTTAFHKLFYLLSSIKILHYMWPKLKNTYNQKLDFTAKISYGSSTKKKTKNFYLLAIDKQNNISINILQVTTTANVFAVDQTETKARVGIDIKGEKPTFKLIKTTDLLSNKYSYQELSNIKSDLAKIMGIFNQYIFIHE